MTTQQLTIDFYMPRLSDRELLELANALESWGTRFPEAVTFCEWLDAFTCHEANRRLRLSEGVLIDVEPIRFDDWDVPELIELVRWASVASFTKTTLTIADLFDQIFWAALGTMNQKLRTLEAKNAQAC